MHLNKLSHVERYFASQGWCNLLIMAASFEGPRTFHASLSILYVQKKVGRAYVQLLFRIYLCMLLFFFKIFLLLQQTSRLSA